MGTYPAHAIIWCHADSCPPSPPESNNVSSDGIFLVSFRRTYYGHILSRKLRMRVVPINFRKVVMSACHVYPLSEHIHEQRILFMILAWFWWPIFNKEVAQFIRASAYVQLVNSCYHEAHHMIHRIDLDTQFDV